MTKKQLIKQLKKENKLLLKTLAANDERYSLAKKLVKLGPSDFTLPSKISLLDSVYRVKIVDKLPNGISGRINYKNKLIEVSKQSPDMARTFLHECSHHFNHILNISNDSELFCNLSADFHSNIFEQIKPTYPKLL